MNGPATDSGLIPRSLQALFSKYQGHIYSGGDVQPFGHDGTRFLGVGEKKEISERKKALVQAGSAEMRLRNQNEGTENNPKSDGVSKDANDGDLATSSGGTVFVIFISFLEVYNEKLFDIFAHGRRTEVKMVDGVGGSVTCKDLTEIPVCSEDEALALFIAGHQKVQISATGANATSSTSRSHSFFKIQVVELENRGRRLAAVRTTQLTFCDLAGCERVDQTHNSGAQLRESANINNSLSSLLKVIRMIRQKQSQGQRDFATKIPFRDSKLTRIFGGYFATCAHITMLVNVNPDPTMAPSTMQTLKNSAIISQVVTKPLRPPPQTLGASSFVRQRSVELENIFENDDFENVSTTAPRSKRQRLTSPNSTDNELVTLRFGQSFKITSMQPTFLEAMGHLRSECGDLRAETEKLSEQRDALLEANASLEAELATTKRELVQRDRENDALKGKVKDVEASLEMMRAGATTRRNAAMNGVNLYPPIEKRKMVKCRGPCGKDYEFGWEIDRHEVQKCRVVNSASELQEKGRTLFPCTRCDRPFISNGDMMRHRVKCDGNDSGKQTKVCK
ncbi:Kinesin-like protein KIF20A [Folsomia candida]|uniref:Kinesin-like protein KIF20A n=1 Tax=Folsomia candida TaxID=158441 RepID=A0A226D732_FOLCA|nr:Kinesin-like protein KIF20A [Folsomia candida]